MNLSDISFRKCSTNRQTGRAIKIVPRNASKWKSRSIPLFMVFEPDIKNFSPGSWSPHTLSIYWLNVASAAIFILINQMNIWFEKNNLEMKKKIQSKDILTCETHRLCTHFRFTLSAQVTDWSILNTGMETHWTLIFIIGFLRVKFYKINLFLVTTHLWPPLPLSSLELVSKNERDLIITQTEMIW